MANLHESASVAVIIRIPFLHFYADANFLRKYLIRLPITMVDHALIILFKIPLTK
jgi:hypothetical protein